MMQEPDFVLYAPPLNAPGVCSDYDLDCLTLPEDQPGRRAEACWAECWSYDKTRGQCPFVD